MTFDISIVMSLDKFPKTEKFVAIAAVYQELFVENKKNILGER